MSHGDASPTTSATTPGRRAALRAGDGLVAAQGAALAGMAWPGPPRWRLPRAAAATAVGAVAAGGLLAVAAARAHGARLTPRVEPVPDATLLTTGVYRVSRHPIYAGLLASAGGVAVLRRRPETLLAWCALAAVLLRKTRREEERLVTRFGDAYASYRATTPRLLGRPTPAPSARCDADHSASVGHDVLGRPSRASSG